MARTRRRLGNGDVAAWLIKSSLPPEALSPGWAPGETRRLDRCLRQSYRLDLMSPEQPCLLWISGRDRPGVHAVGAVVGPPRCAGGGPHVPVELRLLERPVVRDELLRSADFADAEVLRMPAGSNPSYLTAAQLAAVHRLAPQDPSLRPPYGAPTVNTGTRCRPGAPALGRRV